jgi:hypothetical protein
LLGDTSAGLSANAIAEQTGAGYSPTLSLLSELGVAQRFQNSRDAVRYSGLTSPSTN